MVPTTTTPSDLVVLVHGTFAAKREDTGSSWWQIGSSAFDGIQNRVPPGIALTDADEVFHWSGENSERARIKAAAALLQKMKTLESQGRGYHLIGHSHGGSVIWHALRLATLSSIELKRLRSWTTVGTPFLRHTLHSVARFSNILRIVLGIALIKPAFLTAVKFFDLVFRPQSSVWLGHGAPLPKQFTLYETPVLRLLELLNVPMQRTANGIHIVGFGSPTGDNHITSLLTSPVGWLITFLALIAITVYLNLAVFFLRPLIESWQVWAENRLERRARSLYASRWLGLWSPDDEAINGLRATLDLSVSFVSRMAPKDRVLFSDYATVTMQPYYWILTPAFNSFLQPLLDKAVRSIVVKSAQGNNRPGTEVVEVGSAPWQVDGAMKPPSLPDWLNEQLVHDANDAAKNAIPKLRALLAAPSFTLGLESWGKTGRGEELIHTSYFDHEEVLDLIAMHLAGSCGYEQWHEQGESSRRQELANWLVEAKSQVGNHHFSTSTTDMPHGVHSEMPLRSLMRPRRRPGTERAA
jgi:hypothetical protein